MENNGSQRPAQEYKKRRVATALGRIPDHVTYTPIDFATESLAAVLRQAGHRPNEKTFYICEGVSMYVPVRQQIAQASQSGYWLAELIVPECPS